MEIESDYMQYNVRNDYSQDLTTEFPLMDEASNAGVRLVGLSTVGQNKGTQGRAMTAAPFLNSIAQNQSVKLVLPFSTKCPPIDGETSEQPYSILVRTSEKTDPLQAITGRKRASVKLARRIETFDKKRASRMMQCGASFTRDVTTCGHSHASSLHRTDRRCTDRLCPQCARIRSMRLSGSLSEPLRALQGGNGLFAYHIGLTWTDTEHLPEFKTVNGWKRAILKHSFFKRYGYYGAVVSMEVKIGSRSGLFHPHFHCVVFTTKPIPTYKAERNGREVHLFDNAINEELSGAWEEVNGGAGYIVQGELFDGHYEEVLKYIVKSCDDMSDSQLKEFCAWSRGRRFLTMTGKLYANEELKALMNKADDDDGEDEGEQEEAACPHCGCTETRREHLYYDEGRARFVVDKIQEPFTPRRETA